MLRDYFLFNQPWRKFLVHLAIYLPDKVQDKLLQALYPPDMKITING